MGVKSTVQLSREDAENRFVDLYARRKRNKIRSKAAALSNEELEDTLERWNDEVHDGEGYENYIIIV